MQNAKDAKREWIRVALEEGIEIYEPDSLENYSGQFKLRNTTKSTQIISRTFTERRN